MRHRMNCRISTPRGLHVANRGFKVDPDLSSMNWMNVDRVRSGQVDVDLEPPRAICFPRAATFQVPGRDCARFFDLRGSSDGPPILLPPPVGGDRPVDRRLAGTCPIARPGDPGPLQLPSPPAPEPGKRWPSRVPLFSAGLAGRFLGGLPDRSGGLARPPARAAILRRSVFRQLQQSLLRAAVRLSERIPVASSA